MTDEQRWTIGELATIADVTPRTIRYYTAEGLLPQPETRGKYALYGPDHLQRLQLIARLKAAYLPLSEIRSRINRLTTEQVEQLLQEDESATLAAPAETAADYIAQALQNYPAPGGVRAPLGYQSGPDIRAKTGEPHASIAESMQQEPANAARELTDVEPAHRSMLRQLVPYEVERHRQAAGSDQAETWQRIPLASGVELHLREPATPAARERAARLVDLTRRLWRDEP